MRAKLVAIVNQRAAVGKSTLVHNLGVCLAMRQKRVLMVDLDSQAFLTSMCGLYPEEYIGRNISALLGQIKETWSTGGVFEPVKKHYYPIYKEYGVDAKDCCYSVGTAPGVSDFLYLIPSMVDLDDVEIRMNGFLQERAYLFLKEALEPLIDDFDYILLDCPPRKNLLTYCALACADDVLIPSKMDPVSVFALDLFMRDIQMFQEEEKYDLPDPHIVVNAYQARVPLEKQLYESVCTKYHVICTLPVAAAANRGVYDGVSCVEYWPDHEFAIQMQALAATLQEQ